VFLGYAALVMVAGMGVTVFARRLDRRRLCAGGAVRDTGIAPKLSAPVTGADGAVIAACGFFLTKTQFFKERLQAGVEEGKIHRRLCVTSCGDPRP